MARADSNRHEIDRALDKLAHAIDFTARGKDGAIAKDVAKLIALGIRDRVIVDQRLPDGSPMDDNAPDYAARKGYRPVGVGPDRDDHAGGRMLSEVELTGELEVAHDSLTLNYGTSDESRDVAEYFSNGSAPGLGLGKPSGAKGQPSREFYALDDRIESQVGEYLDAYLDDLLKRI